MIFMTYYLYIYIYIFSFVTATLARLLGRGILYLCFPFLFYCIAPYIHFYLVVSSSVVLLLNINLYTWRPGDQ